MYYLINYQLLIDSAPQSLLLIYVPTCLVCVLLFEIVWQLHANGEICWLRQYDASDSISTVRGLIPVTRPVQNNLSCRGCLKKNQNINPSCVAT